MRLTLYCLVENTHIINNGDYVMWIEKNVILEEGKNFGCEVLGEAHGYCVCLCHVVSNDDVMCWKVVIRETIQGYVLIMWCVGDTMPSLMAHFLMAHLWHYFKKQNNKSCSHIYTYIHTYMHTYIHTYLHAYIHTYVHACIKIYTYTLYILHSAFYRYIYRYIVM